MPIDEEQKLAIASFRYRIIAEAIELDDGISAVLGQAAKKEYADTNGQLITVSERELWRWLKAWRQEGLSALVPKTRTDKGQLRAISEQVLQQAIKLRKEKHSRSTKTIIDILERTKVVKKGEIKRSTLDRHFEHLGLSRRQLHRLGKKVFRQIKTQAPLELVIADFHHGPYVRVGTDDQARRALLLAFIDHFSRYILDGRYYLHEDFAALRFGFRRVLLIWGILERLYVDRARTFQSNRFHAACKNRDLDITVVHSKPYVSEGRGACERFNRTIKEQFESEVRGRDELLTLDELNAYHEAWLAERYHRDIHSETGQTPKERFEENLIIKPAPNLERIDELLRIRQRSKVHKKWSTVEVKGNRYVVEPSLRGRHVYSLYDPFDFEYVLIEFDGRIIQRAYKQKPGEKPPQPPTEKNRPDSTDYLAILRDDFEKRTLDELSALRLRPPNTAAELTQSEFEALLENCCDRVLSQNEKIQMRKYFRKLRPLDPTATRLTLEGAARRLGKALHIGIYLETLQKTLVVKRAKGELKK